MVHGKIWPPDYDFHVVALNVQTKGAIPFCILMTWAVVFNDFIGDEVYMKLLKYLNMVLYNVLKLKFKTEVALNLLHLGLMKYFKTKIKTKIDMFVLLIKYSVSQKQNKTERSAKTIFRIELIFSSSKNAHLVHLRIS